ncbi:MAG TPA: ATP-binding protein [Pyrinomonadaceae bacterium]|nr:ATP-binding protein [Pyrinomonadaceae bacterium]
MTLNQLLKSLLNLPKETEWVEFKLNNDKPEAIGEYLSALSNSAALHGKEGGYLVWGIEDGSHNVLGTTAQPQFRKIGNEELENWLAHNLSPRVDFRFHEFEHENHRVVLVRVQPALGSPVSFKGVEWIRVGGIKKKLKDHTGKEKELWLALARLNFERSIAAQAVTADEVLARLDYPKYFELSGQNLPDNRSGILERLKVDRLIVGTGDETFDITNLGAILFAKKLSDFGSLARKAFRVVRYKGTNRVVTEYEKLGTKGYAAGFEGLVGYINDQVPRNEVLGQALRREVRMYPERAIRELVANAMIHQDFGISGTGPMVEIFDDRMEISNPGLPLIDPLRFIDHAPRSRNEILADLMRRLGICEERGSGFDKVVFETAVFQLPAPDIRIDTTHTRVILFGHQKLSEMSGKDKVRSCYQHCVLLYVSNKKMTNATLRERFQIAEPDYPIASRIIRDTIDAGLIKPEDPDSKSKKHARYVPFWA